jgi:hypothetical protein
MRRHHEALTTASVLTAAPLLIPFVSVLWLRIKSMRQAQAAEQKAKEAHG